MTKKFRAEELNKEDLNPKDKIGRKKDPIHLVPTEGIRGISHAMRYGAYEAKRVDGKQGYGPFNWRDTKISYTVYLDAIMRHTMKLIDGEDIDQDSGVSHESHIGANICILLDAKKEGVLVDDRPKTTKEKSLDTLNELTQESQELGLYDEYHSSDEFRAKPYQGISLNTVDADKFLKHVFPESFACKEKLCKCEKKIKDQPPKFPDTKL